MDEAIQQIVEAFSRREADNPLRSGCLEEVCETYQTTMETVSYLFAKHVGLGFAEGVLSFRQADTAMNRLGVERAAHSDFAWRIYEAFDSGEYQHEGDTLHTIGWQKYTLPLVMEALGSEGLLPRT